MKSQCHPGTRHHRLITPTISVEFRPAAENAAATFWNSSSLRAYLADVSHLNFGTDVSQYPASVSSLIAQTIPWTIILVGTATVIAFAVGTALGIMAGWRHGGWLDRVLPGLMFFQAMPYFFLALILLELLAVRAHLFPLGQDRVARGIRPHDPAAG